MNRIFVTVVSLVILSGTSLAEETKPNIKVLKDRGWGVCRSLVQELRSLPIMDQSIVCGGPLPLSPKKFTVPKWQELNVSEYLDVIYSIETAIRMGLAREIPPFDVWRKEYQAQIKAGAIQPRLRQADLRFATGGPTNTVLAYMPDQHRTGQCRKDVAKGKAVLAVGDYIFPFDPEHRKARFIYPKTGSGTTSELPFHVLAHDNNAYLFWVSPLDQSASSVVVSRIIRRDPARQGMELKFYADEICNVQYDHPSPVAR